MAGCAWMFETCRRQCFEHPNVHPQEDLYMQFYGISLMHSNKQSGRWKDVLGCSKRVEDTIIELNH